MGSVCQSLALLWSGNAFLLFVHHHRLHQIGLCRECSWRLCVSFCYRPCCRYFLSSLLWYLATHSRRKRLFQRSLELQWFHQYYVRTHQYWPAIHNESLCYFCQSKYDPCRFHASDEDLLLPQNLWKFELHCHHDQERHLWSSSILEFLCDHHSLVLSYNWHSWNR